MKKYITGFLSMIVAACFMFAGCQEDKDVTFDATFPQNSFSFKPIPGGAVMHYKIPNDKDVIGIKVRYHNAQGKEVLRAASYACDSVELIGFNEARQGVEAFVTLCARNLSESEPVRVTFDTKDSGPVLFMNNVEIRSGWHGFDMKYAVPDGAKGLAHVFYLGKSPFTEGIDTLLLGSYAFNGGEGTMHFDMEQAGGKHTIVVRTEDFAGYIVKEKVWENIEAYEISQLPASEFDFTASCNVITDENAKLGAQYLFDGDTKGLINFPVNNKNYYYTFLAGPNAVGAPFIVDLREPKQIASTKLYAMLYLNNRDIPYKGSLLPYADIWNGAYQNKLPCSVTIYGTNDKDNSSSWKQIGSYEEMNNTPNANRWCRYCLVNDEYIHRISDLDAAQAADPISLSINIKADESPYRYLILVVNDTYAARYAHMDQNENKYVTLHEWEIYTKAE